ncbi:hypothetical protein VNI00_000207 [Paramarasmius palmivorus]|uniref:SMAD/FHA domain-containing protein n=1 Tax=Paramarasmius palmivorus TaxID=297713 RepID=A0AAW0EEC0_9AGAR
MDPNSHAGNDSPPLRSTILSSFLRGRPRNSSQSHTDPLRELSPSPPSHNQPPSPGAIAAVAAVTNYTNRIQPSTSNPPSLGLSHMLRRRRSAGAINTSTTTQQRRLVLRDRLNSPIHPPPPPPVVAGTYRIRLVPHLESRRSLKFDPITRDLKPSDAALRIGRFTDRSGLGLAAVNALGSNKLAFKSKVVSRAHAEISVDSTGKFWIKDTKSSSGTFLNHMRLSPANTESRAHQVRDGDILQLGVDYQGGTEDIYKSVKIRIELGREWQSGANAFNTTAIKNLKTLAVGVTSTTTPRTMTGGLFGVTIRQALFIAPCSHAFHYKCIRPLLENHHPAFSCPLCRTFADLEEDVEIEIEYEEEDLEMLEDDGPLTAGPSNAKNALSSNANGQTDDGEDSGVEEVAAALRSGMTGPSPQAEREREREREREAGAETEVEADNGLNPFRNRRAAGNRSVRRRQSRAMSFMDEGDELFVPTDGEAAGRSAGHSEEELVLLDVGGDEVERGSGSEAGNPGLVALERDADMADLAGFYDGSSEKRSDGRR